MTESGIPRESKATMLNFTVDCRCRIRTWFEDKGAAYQKATDCPCLSSCSIIRQVLKGELGMGGEEPGKERIRKAMPLGQNELA